MRISNLDLDEMYGFIDDAGEQRLLTAGLFIQRYGDLLCTLDEFFPTELIYVEGGFLF